MAFTDDFTGTSGDDLSTRTGWTKATDGAVKISIFTSGVEASVGSGGGGSGATVYTCTDQGGANQYTQQKVLNFSGKENNFLCVRLVDKDNFIAWRLFGTGGAGRRLSKKVSGTITDLITSQGVDDEFVKVEADGNTIKLFEGGTGASPSWTQVGSDQTVSDHNTETTQGYVVEDTAGDAFYDDFEAGVLGAAPPAGDIFNQLQSVGRGVGPQHALTLGGVLQ